MRHGEWPNFKNKWLEKIQFDDNNNIKVTTRVTKKVVWQNGTDFGKGTDTNTEVNGTNDAAVIRLADQTDLDDDFDYETAGDYTLSDGTKLEIDSGEVRLKAQSGDSVNYPYTTVGNYTLSDAGAIQVSGGVAKLIPVSDLLTGAEAFWTLNETSGNRADSVGSNTLTDSGAVGYDTGKVNNAARFDNSADQLSITDNASLSFSDEDMTVAFWVYYDGTSFSSHLIGKWGTGGHEWAVYQPSSGGPRFIVTHNGSTTALVTESTALTVGTWNFVVAWHDSTANTINIQVNNGTIRSTAHSLGLYNGTSAFTVGNTSTLGTNLDGRIDAAGVWRRVLTSDEKNYLYNSGNGKEVLVEYPTSNPTVTNNAGFVFSGTVITFTETATKPAGTAIKYILSTDDGSTWEYWNGSAWVTSDTTYAQSSSGADVSANIGMIASSGTLKVRAFLNSDSTATPQLDNIYIETTGSYATNDNLYADSKDASQLDITNVITFLTATITNTKPANTDIRVLFSNDGRASWLTWSGSAWVAPASATTRTDATSITDAQTNITSLPVGSNNTSDVRIFLYTSDNTVRPSVSNINVTADKGYQTSGNWESNIFNSGNLSQVWSKIRFTLTTPSGTTISIVGKASNKSDLSDTSYGSALSNGEETNLVGQYLQLKVTFTGTQTVRADCDDVGVEYQTNTYQEVAP